MLKQNLKKSLGALCGILLFISCNNDDDTPTTPEANSAEFTVTIKNVIEAKDYFASGTTTAIMPGNNISFSFDAGEGHYLNLATMYVKSNDLFFAPNEEGFALYNEDGTAVTGDVTSAFKLWDAGTEENEMPGTGANQPDNQEGPNTGTDENGTVQLIENIDDDDFMYPSVEEAIRVNVAHDGGTRFTVTITNLTNNLTLPSPLAPGVWVVNFAEQSALFTTGEAASEGLENLAEDGNNMPLAMAVSAASGYVSPYAPGTYAIGENTIFTDGSAASEALENLAEDGNVSGYMNVFNTPVGSSNPGPILPTNSYSFTFTAEAGDKLSFATMLIQSNDWFIGADEINLFNNGTPISGDITSMVSLYDAGTEVDEYAGAGSTQPLRQGTPNTGSDEGGTVEEETAKGDHVPAVSGLIEVMITSSASN